MKVVHVLFVLLIIVFALSNFLQAQQEQQHSLDGITWENLQQSYRRYCQKLCMKIFTERIPLAFITPRF